MLTRRHLLTAAPPHRLPRPRRLWAASTLDAGVLPDRHAVGRQPGPAGRLHPGRHAARGDAGDRRQVRPADRQLTPPCNVTLLRDGTNTVLFDVGAGPDFQPTAGKLFRGAGGMGLTPEDITHVFFTHGHPDHLWGLLDEFDEPVFPNAEYMIGQAEFDYWTDPDTVDSIGEARTTFAVGAARRLAVIADARALLADGDEPLPGIAARLTPGHTPGHLAFEMRDGPTPAWCWAMHRQPPCRLRAARLGLGSDQDAEAAATTRVALLDQIASGRCG
jgi:hypothetical protein